MSRAVIVAPTYDETRMVDAVVPPSAAPGTRVWQHKIAPGIRVFVTLSTLTYWRVEGLAGLDRDRLCLGGGPQRAANEACRQVKALSKVLRGRAA